MLTQENPKENVPDCRFCSLVSKANGEDPIGTAGTADHWLIFELPLPWKEKLPEDPRVRDAIAPFQTLAAERGVTFRTIAIAPEPEYARPGVKRVLYYRRPDRPFARFEKQEFVVPTETFPALTQALCDRAVRGIGDRAAREIGDRTAENVSELAVRQIGDLPGFQQYQQKTDRVRDLLVCTHGNVDAACARFGYPIYKTLRDKYAKGSDGNLRVWRCSHFGGHRFAPTLLDLPQGQFWGHLEPDVLDAISRREGAIADLQRFYRGWAGFDRFAQVAEREIWLHEGWDWLAQHKSARIVGKKLKGIRHPLHALLQPLPWQRVRSLLARWAKDAVWVDVCVEFASPDRSTSGAYRVRVAFDGKITTVGKSPKLGREIQTIQMPQYRVDRLVKLA